MKRDRRVLANKSQKILFGFFFLFLVYYFFFSQTDPNKPKFQGSLRTYFRGSPPTSPPLCVNLGCVEFPIHHNILDKLDKEDSDKAKKMCSNTFWHTLTTTIKKTDENDYFVFTGDIPHMWLRDSAAQIHGYLSLAASDPGVINRTAFYINYDPYANAYSFQDGGVKSQVNCEGCYGYVAEWKYELDSTCYFIRLLYTFWSSMYVIPPILSNPKIHQAVNRILDVWITEQNHFENAHLQNYHNPAINQSLYRNTGYNYELKGNGRGTPVKYTGLIWSGFRPSDDACQYGYLIPSNMFASVVLNYIKILAKQLFNDDEMYFRATKLKLEVDNGLKIHATVSKGDLYNKYGTLYAYEVDGNGNTLLADDANVPSLLSIPYLGYDYDKEIYQNTRKFLLSSDNPNYFQSGDGKFKGIGSIQHTGYNNIWPMSQLIQGLTSRDPEEKLDLLKQLLHSDANTGWMHESYNVNNPNQFSRPWFCWADALFGEFVMSMTNEDCRGKRPNVTGLDL